MAHIRKHPITGKAQVRYRDPSGKERSKTFVRRSDARAYKSQIEHSIARGAYIDGSLSKTAFSEVAAPKVGGQGGAQAVVVGAR